MLPAFYLLRRRPITIMGATTDTAITAITIGIATTTIIIVTVLGSPLSTVAPATTATIEILPVFEIALVFVRLDHVASSIANADREHLQLRARWRSGARSRCWRSSRCGARSWCRCRRRWLVGEGTGKFFHRALRAIKCASGNMHRVLALDRR